jgi:hypothetical protein
MRRMFVIVLGIVGVLALVIGAGWFACVGWRTVAARYEDTASYATPIREIHVSGKSVWVELRAGDAPGVEIRRTVRYLNPLHGRPAAIASVQGDALELRGEDAGAFSATEYVVTAPAGVRVTAEVGTGSLDLAGVSTVNATVGTGAVAVADATGDITAHVGTGQITGTGLRSEAVVATTGTGAISLQLASPGNVDATTATGSVDVLVPSAAYRVEASSRMGAVRIGIPSDPGAAYRLALRAGTGQVTVASH